MQLVDVDGTLHAVVVRDGRWRTVEVGPSGAGPQGDGPRAVRAAQRDPRPTGRPRRAGPSARDGPAGTSYCAAARRTVPWWSHRPPPCSRRRGDSSPSLHDRPVALTPSATAWVRAHAAVAALRPGRVRRGTGPADRGRRGRGGRRAARGAPRGRRRRDRAAVLAALDGAALAHIAAHGFFRAETPMFSSLHLADGPMTVDDVHRLAHPPHRIVLPACRSGVVAPSRRSRRHRLRGRAARHRGPPGSSPRSSTSTTPPTVQVMLDLHAGLAAGERLDEALRRARRRGGRRPRAAAPPRCLFVALGAA